MEISENKVVNYNILDEHSNRFQGKSILTLADKYYRAFKSANDVDNSVEIIRSKNKENEQENPEDIENDQIQNDENGELENNED